MESNKFKPQLEELHSYYHSYISDLPDVAIPELLRGIYAHEQLLREMPEDKKHYKYAEGKWTIAELMAHLVHCELIFSYRAMRIAHENGIDIQPFDQDIFITNEKKKSMNYDKLVDQLFSLRNNNILMFEQFSDEELKNQGMNAGHPMSCRAIGFILQGHAEHHLKVLMEKYFV